MEDLTMKLGLLMEAAQAQQALAAAVLQQLREHTGGLDAIVREEIRGTLIEELTALGDDSRRAAQTLRGLSHVASLRVAAWSVGVTALSAAIPFGVAWWMLPLARRGRALRTARDELTTISRGSPSRADTLSCDTAERLDGCACASTAARRCTVKRRTTWWSRAIERGRRGNGVEGLVAARRCAAAHRLLRAAARIIRYSQARRASPRGQACTARGRTAPSSRSYAADTGRRPGRGL